MPESNQQGDQYEKKWEAGSNYFGQSRPEIEQLISTGDNAVLDIGCATGALGDSLKHSRKASVVFGIEGFSEAAKKAAHALDKVHHGDLEFVDFAKLKREWDDICFDYVIFGDVLEHLQDPWSILRQSAQFLGPNGKIIVSLPNVRHWSVSASLVLLGRWSYRDSGILDRTHLRFFTKSSAKALVEDSGFSVDKVSLPVSGRRSELISRVSGGLLDEFLSIQILVEASLNGRGRTR